MNINNKRPNYAERYIEHADTPETRARGRRWKAFLAESGLKENLQDDPPKHRALIEAVGRGLLAHTTNLELGNMAVLMTEHYHAKLEDFDHERFAVIEVPTNIAPYCGGFDRRADAMPGTRSWLIASSADAGVLKQLEVLLWAAAIRCTKRWNEV
jgi:hypothetical protein